MSLWSDLFLASPQKKKKKKLSFFPGCSEQRLAYIKGSNYGSQNSTGKNVLALSLFFFFNYMYINNVLEMDLCLKKLPLFKNNKKVIWNKHFVKKLFLILSLAELDHRPLTKITHSFKKKMKRQRKKQNMEVRDFCQTAENRFPND